MRAILISLAVLLGAAAAQAAPPPIEAYGRFENVSSLSLSPSGKRAAFLVTNDKGRRIAVQEVGGALLATVEPGPAKLRDISFAGDDFLLISTSATINLGMEWGYEHELTQVQIVDLKTLKPILVFGESKMISNVVQGTYGVARVGGRWYGYFGGMTLAGDTSNAYLSHGYPDLYQVDLESGATHLAARGGEKAHDWVVSATGEVVAHSEYDRKTGIWRLIQGPGSGGREVLSRKTPLGEIALVSQGRSPGTVLISDGSGDDIVHEEISLADGRSETLLQDAVITSYLLDSTTNFLVGAEVQGPAGAVLFSPALQAKVRGALHAFPGKRARLAAADPGFDKMIVTVDGGDDSGSYWFVDIDKRSAIPLASIRLNVPPASVGPTRMFAYKAADGLELEGVLTLPAGRAPKDLPLVVMPHGGPLGVRDDVGFDWWAQAYASRGYAVFQPNYRGSAGYGRAFQHLGFGEWGRKMLTDMSDGVAALAKQGIIDPKRACIVGGSYGGYAALAGVTVQQGLYRCAVAYAGVSDLPAQQRWDLDRRGGDQETLRYWRTAIHGDANGAPSLGGVSPARLAERADAPILLIHGRDDTVVPIDQSRKMLSALKAAHKSVQYVEQAGQDHWLSSEAGRVEAVKASVEFVQRYNPAD